MEIELILHATAGPFAGDDVAQVDDGEDVLLHGSGLGFGEALNAIVGEDEVEIEGTIGELNEVFAPDDFGLGVVIELEAECEEGGDDALAVFSGLGGKNVHILGGTWIAKEDGTALADEEVIHACRVERLGDFLRLKRVEWQAVVHSTGAG